MFQYFHPFDEISNLLVNQKNKHLHHLFRTDNNIVLLVASLRNKDRILLIQKAKYIYI